MSQERELDVAVFGATGFTGRLVAGYLAEHAPGGVRVGLAGRSEKRLADVRAQLPPAASAWPLLVADSADPASLAALAQAARVVVSTVGPYRRQGLALVEACAAAGTDYADLTGEVLFIRDSIDRCHDHFTRLILQQRDKQIDSARIMAAPQPVDETKASLKRHREDIL